MTHEEAAGLVLLVASLYTWPWRVFSWRSGRAILCSSLAMLVLSEVTPLHEAASKGHTETVAQLEAGADPNTGFTLGLGLLASQTPLHAAKGHTKTVLALLEAGADPNAPGMTLGLGLRISATPLDSAADGGHIETVAALLKAGADPNAPGFTLGPGLLGASRTPLDAAAKGGHTKMVSALLKAGANPHARQHVAFGIKLLTPLDVARINGHTEMVPALLTAEAHTHRPIMSSETEVTGSTALVLLVATLYSLYRWPYLRSACWQVFKWRLGLTLPFTRIFFLPALGPTP